MAKRVLITGITGFAGSHLADHLLDRGGFEIYGLYRWRSRMENVEGFKDKINLIEGDIRDAASMRSLIEKINPDWVFHLAAQSYVPMSWKAPAETLSTNVIGEVNLFEACRKARGDPLIHIAGSSEEYGLVHPDEVPIAETTPLHPLSPYGVSKVAQDLLAFQYFKSYGLRVIRTRAFNHTGPRRGEVFVTSSFARQIVMIEKGQAEPLIRVGNLDAVRDFSDVRDIARAYTMALERCEPGEVYNICSGKGIKIRELLDMLIAQADVNITIKEDPARMRPSDVEFLIGDATRFRAKTGWKPEIAFKQTLADLLDFWRERV
ncbi:GDP-mannose 4,6-dehydratase [candidate division TA06 bacterium B3_TA06]|uniref:GDP-mannose 4,6-dehydratase n=1 Tax=candidate division TA06 bacterium B3_TA06 TaxID=2012487 RepID=A0A532V7H4_UNCT6|nr:MAG: GDP-mannose 4,6-dehydratase [candidate division TA06 bacterium B3_TA06]